MIDTCFLSTRCVNVFFLKEFIYLAGHSMGTEFAKPQRWLNPSKQCHYIQMLNPSPVLKQNKLGFITVSQDKDHIKTQISQL